MLKNVKTIHVSVALALFSQSKIVQRQVYVRKILPTHLSRKVIQ